MDKLLIDVDTTWDDEPDDKPEKPDVPEPPDEPKPEN